LEDIGTLEGRQFLHKLEDGVVGARVTCETKKALDRLAL
jgi:hypothetical protein